MIIVMIKFYIKIQHSKSVLYNISHYEVDIDM